MHRDLRPPCPARAPSLPALSAARDPARPRTDHAADSAGVRRTENPDYQAAVQTIRDLCRTPASADALASIHQETTPPTIVVCLDTETYGSAIERARLYDPPVVLVMYRPGSGRVCAIRPDDLAGDERPEFWNDPLAAIIASGWVAVADLPPAEFDDDTLTAP